MTLFQLLSLIPLGILATISVLSIVRRRGRLRISLLWLAVWISTATAILRPQVAVTVAAFVGIGRGADLVFYCNVLMTLSGFFYVYVRQRALQRQITVLVRQLAISHPFTPEGDARPPSAGA